MEPSGPTTTAPTGGLPATKDSQASSNASRHGAESSAHCSRASPFIAFIVAEPGTDRVLHRVEEGSARRRAGGAAAAEAKRLDTEAELRAGQQRRAVTLRSAEMLLAPMHV